MVVVADSSPLRYLIVLGEQRLLPELLGETWIPTAVLEELTVDSTPMPVRDFLTARPAWLKVGDPSFEAIQSISEELDMGERAALAPAREMNADLVLLDDAAGRAEAQSLGLRLTGTVGLLRLAAERNMIDVADVVARLRASGFYLSDSLVQSAFGRWL